jgi:competence ComEA-like helix-hairpin-helix protein
MKLTKDESRALSFIAALVLLSAAVRFATLPAPLAPPTTAGFDLDAHIAATERAVAEEERRNRPLEPGERLDLNTAPEAELVRLPGVGPRLAERIVAARRARRFTRVEELTRVSGIGDRTAARLAPYLTLPRSSARPDRGDVGVRGRRGSPTSPTSGVVRGRATPVSGGGAARGPGAGSRVDINAAGVDELETLPGVGPVLAARIVAYRDSAGPFVAVDSLVRVKGIGSATLEALRSRVRVR